MADEQTADRIEEHIGLTQPDAFEQTTDGESVTSKHIFADGGDGKEKEAVLHDHRAGASSDAPAGSGIPSAEKQHGVRGEAFDPQTEETPMADHVLPHKQNLEP